MPEPSRRRDEKGRLRVAFFSCLALAGLLTLSACGHGNSALRSSLQVLMPSHQDVSRLAARIPYAAIDITVAGNGGLLVLAEESSGTAYFQSPSRDVIVLHNGYLDQAAGLMQDLLMTRVFRKSGLTAPPWRLAVPGVPFEYQVQRLWRTKNGILHADQARATLLCQEDTVARELPLATVDLQRCQETLLWSNGERTQSLLWRYPLDNRLWAVRTVAWPGGPVFAWQVARPWW